MSSWLPSDLDTVVLRLLAVREMAQELTSPFRNYGVTVKVEGRVADRIGSKIVTVAEEIDAARIIVGGRRRTPAGKALFGSTAQAMLLEAPCPVTFVPDNWTRFEVVGETTELRASVEQDIQAKIDHSDDEWVEDGRLFGQTLKAEEKMATREWEIERTHWRMDDRQASDREARTRRVASRGSAGRRREFGKRAARVDPKADPDRADPRERLSREMLGAVNEEATRLVGEMDGMTRAAISRRLAERIEASGSLLSATVGLVEGAKTARGTVVPIGELEEVWREDVSIEGTVTQLWKPAHPAISQVGLTEDESGVTKFTAWAKSKVPLVEKGERVRFRGVKKSWYQGRCSVALTSDTLVEFPERERWYQG